MALRHLTHLSQDTSPLILSNFSASNLQSSELRHLLKLHSIENIKFTDLITPESSFVRLDSPEERFIHVVRIPKIKNYNNYASLFALSKNPVGVTGNLSLFMALTLGKFPVYDINISGQSEVNAYLSTYDKSGLLRPAFYNLIEPEQKAKIIAEHHDLITSWANNTLSSNSNDVIIKLVEWATTPNHEVHEFLKRIDHLSIAAPTEINLDNETALTRILIWMRRKFRKYNQAVNVEKCIAPNFHGITSHDACKLRNPELIRAFIFQHAI